ncbi:hypothetical protein CRUP_000579, partial [Coryphaenoides rupestris]
INCGDPGVPANGVRVGGDFTFARTVTFQCSPGFTMDADRASSLVCTKDRTWNATKPHHINEHQLSAIVCPPPPVIPNGQVVGTDFIWGGSISYACNQGYQLSLPTVLTCQGGGQLERREAPPCSVGTRVSRPQGRREDRGFTYLSSVSFTCYGPDGAWWAPPGATASTTAPGAAPSPPASVRRPPGEGEGSQPHYLRGPRHPVFGSQNKQPRLPGGNRRSNTFADA